MNNMATNHGPAEADHGPAKAGRHVRNQGPAKAGHYVQNHSPAESRLHVRNVGVRHELNDAARWNAVVDHDREADGLFVYAVRSTGIYCRPSCQSRRPRRDRVAFFETPAAARTAGFRACLRCKPDATVPVADPWVEKIRRACVYLSNVDGHPALA